MKSIFWEKGWLFFFWGFMLSYPPQIQNNIKIFGFYGKIWWHRMISISLETFLLFIQVTFQNLLTVGRCMIRKIVVKCQFFPFIICFLLLVKIYEVFDFVQRKHFIKNTFFLNFHDLKIFKKSFFFCKVDNTWVKFTWPALSSRWATSAKLILE